jgi:hypothetical protein
VGGARPLASRAIAYPDIEIPIVWTAGLGERIEDHIPHGMDRKICPASQNFARPAFKSRIVDVGVGPFRDDTFKSHIPGRWINRLYRLKSAEVKTGQGLLSGWREPSMLTFSV